MNKLEKDGPEEIAYKGKIFEIVKQPMKVDGKSIVFETARRSPGTRLMIVRDDKMIISREYRTEIEGFDYRLPGGKVFDTLDEYNEHMSEDILPHARDAALRECKEETGLIAKNMLHFVTAQAGSTVEWDLFYFVIDEYDENEKGQELEIGEVIETQWKTFSEVKELCKNGAISEDRTIGILFKFFLQYPERYDQLCSRKE